MSKVHLNKLHLSKKLSWLLRHGAIQEGFQIKSDGFLIVSEILQHPKYKHDYTQEILEEIVKNDAKQRYTMRRNAANGALEIRANQGHSMHDVLTDAANLARITNAVEVPIAVHGTYMKNWPSIKSEGLKTMTRNHVHFASTDHVAATGAQTSGAISGFRRDCQVLIYLDVAKALMDGLELYRSTNNVILCAGINGVIDKKYFQKVIKRNTVKKVSSMQTTLPGSIKMTPTVTNQTSTDKDKNEDNKQTETSNDEPLTKVATTTTTTQDTNNSSSSISNSRNNNDCKICGKSFETMQECLKHELLEHANDKLRAPRSLRNKLNTVLKGFTNNDRLSEVHKILAECEPGNELDALCKYYALNMENLDMVYTRIQQCLAGELKAQYKLYPYGSIVTGLALRDSDIDIYIEDVNPNQTHRTTFNRVNSLLRRSKCFEDVIAIRHARVPIIKCKHGQTGFSLDINMSSPSSNANSQFLRNLVQFDVRLHKLMLFIKMWAKQLHIIGSRDMTSYCLVTLILFFLQQQTLLPSIRDLQSNCTPIYILGINYAYNLNILRPWPEHLRAIDLIKLFFNYYNNFEFKNTIISPYLGRAITIQEFIEGTCDFPEYFAQQLSVIEATHNEPEYFQLQRCVCVQDAFSLSHNVAKSIGAANLIYLRQQLGHAARICNDTKISSDAELYEKLLFSSVSDLMSISMSMSIANAELNAKTNARKTDNATKVAPEMDAEVGVVAASSGNVRKEQRMSLYHTVIPSRADIRAITNFFLIKKLATEHTIYYYWMKEYIKFIKQLVGEIFCIDMQPTSPKHTDKHQRMDNERDYSWEISSSVDMWTGRNHQRVGSETYINCQLIQTECFQKQRRQNANFAIDMKGILTLEVSADYKQIIIVVKAHDYTGLELQRNSPLSKFFAALRCGLQGFKLKEALQNRETLEFH